MKMIEKNDTKVVLELENNVYQRNEHIYSVKTNENIDYSSLLF